jgi:hypothetical protein
VCRRQPQLTTTLFLSRSSFEMRPSLKVRYPQQNAEGRASARPGHAEARPSVSFPTARETEFENDKLRGIERESADPSGDNEKASGNIRE